MFFPASLRLLLPNFLCSSRNCQFWNRKYISFINMRMGDKKWAWHNIVCMLYGEANAPARQNALIWGLLSLFHFVYTSLLQAHNNMCVSYARNLRVEGGWKSSVCDKYQPYVSFYVHTNLSNWSAPLYNALPASTVYMFVHCHPNDIFICGMSLILNRVKWTAENSTLFSFVWYHRAVFGYGVIVSIFFLLFVVVALGVCIFVYAYFVYGFLCTSLNYNFWTVFNY